MREFVFEAADEAATEQFAQLLTSVLPEQATVSLIGPLGAGKTRLVKAVATAAGVEPSAVTSPTFVLIQEYAGSRAIYHFDTYRLRDEDEFIELAPDEYFARSGWTFVEWGDRFARCLPDERLEIRIDVTGPTSRRFTITPLGKHLEPVIEKLKKECDHESTKG
jgi:tRNA threonylcarbamoyladenosine biosynthesis protein TsaE